MNWGKGIIIAFIIFAGLVITMVIISMKQEVGLVAPDYYKQEIAYQDQIDRINNYETLKEKPVIRIDRNTRQLVLKFPQLLRTSMQNGRLELFRPSTSRVDEKYPLQLNEDGEQRINVSNLLRGRWKVKLFWETHSLEYYNEVAINL